MSWGTCVVAALVAGAAIYQIVNLPSAPIASLTLPAPPTQPSAQKQADEAPAPEQPAPPRAQVQSGPALAPKAEPTIAGKDAAPVDDKSAQDVASTPALAEPARLPEAATEAPVEDHAAAAPPAPVAPPERIVTREDLSLLSYYAYAEVLPDIKPADTVLAYLKTIPPGTPIEDIRQVSDALGLDFTFMKAVAKIESGFDPKQRTGSYIGLYQLSKSEFAKYGSGDILDPRDNAIAASLKFMTESMLFELYTHKKPTLSDVYLIHQQGIDGAAEHVSHPHRLAWQSMCATDEGREKGEKWCKRAIWGNTLPAVKRLWKTVDKLTSGAFVAMWQQRVSEFYTRYSEAAAK
jgi:hypothetical protein